MNLRTRKLVIVSLIAAVILLVNSWAIAGWLDHTGAVGLASHLWSEHLTGTAVAVIVALLYLFGSPGGRGWIDVQSASRSRVCDQRLVQQGRYCAACGSRVCP